MPPPRIVELSHRIIPGKEHFQLETRIDDVTNILPEVKHRPDVWYVLGAVTYCTHVGTHIEVPFHHFKEGDDVADFPFRQLIGPLVVLDFRHKKDQEAITLDEIKVHDAKIHAGDIVFIWTGMDELYRTERWNEQPHLTIEANNWLVEKRIACLGSDAAGLEVPGTDHQPNHQAIFRAGIPMIESATNLGQVQEGQYLVFILPLPIEGLEASPLRIIAIEKEDLVMHSDKSYLLGLLKKMLELRAVDARLYPLKLKDLVMDGLHPYIGQEAVAVGICSALKPDDYLISTHRPQGHALAKGATMRSIYCEMLGRMGGPSNGLGGPMQWIDVDHYFFCGSIVGSGVSYSTGFALAAKREGKGRITACFFGDGTSGTGACHEGMNLAALWKLPLLYVCENNQYGEAMPVKDFVPVANISERGAAYGIPGKTVDGMDVLAVAEAADEAAEAVRSGRGPVLLETVTYRYKGHYYGDPDNYRTKDEIRQWQAKDPIDRLRKHLLEAGLAAGDELKTMEEEIEGRAEADRDWALRQPTATLDCALSNVLAPINGRAC